MLKNLCVRFSVFGCMIVALQLLPNIVWALFPPAVNRLEGDASSVPFLEYGEHILGVAIVILLLFLVNGAVPNKVHRGAPAILPPFAFFSAGLAEKVYPVSAASALFLVFHLLVTLENFPIGTAAIIL